MSISSRTPEGFPNRCPICGAEFVLEPSQPTGDAPCPQCGQLLWWVGSSIAGKFGLVADAALANMTLEELRDLVQGVDADSLDMVELVMKLEEEFDLDFPDEGTERDVRIEALVQYLIGARKKPPT
jgi:acyl carrier protein